MKKIIFLIATSILMNCKSTMNETNSNNLAKVNSNCPEDGICNLTIHKNKSLDVKKDEFNKIYYHLLDNENVTTYIYDFQTKTDSTLQDATYKEEIIFELKNNEILLDLNNEDLKNIKLIIGRHKFERSNNVGYFEVTKGNFTLKDQKITVIIETEKPFLMKNIVINK
jgi:hypothetical protein